MKMERYNKDKKDLEDFKKEFLVEKKRKKGKIIKEIFNDGENNSNYNDSSKEMELENDENSDNDISMKQALKSSNRIEKINFDSDDDSENKSGYSDWGSDSEDSFKNGSDKESSDEENKNEKKASKKKPFDINFRVNFYLIYKIFQICVFM